MIIKRVNRFFLVYLCFLLGICLIGSQLGADSFFINPHALFLQLYQELSGGVTEPSYYYLFNQDKIFPHGTWVALMFLILAPVLLTVLILKIRDRVKGRRHFDIQV
ncbi:MAG: hypothetical protein QNL04_07890 [SAR324 cluster bacterium]|nr:hypothetical protein [SAR324 cluster bacterium]